MPYRNILSLPMNAKDADYASIYARWKRYPCENSHMAGGFKWKQLTVPCSGPDWKSANRTREHGTLSFYITPESLLPIKNAFIFNEGPPYRLPGYSCVTMQSQLIVTEPGCSQYDLKRTVDYCRHFIHPVVSINKCDLNEKCREEIKQYCSEEIIFLFGEIPFRMAYPEAIANRQIPSEYSGEIAREVLNIWQAIRMAL